MMRPWMAPWLLLAVPILGAGLSWLWRAALPRMKTAALVAAAASLCSVIGSALALGEPSVGVPFLCLLPLTAYLSLLGQPLHRDTSPTWPVTLMLLGLGLGTLTSQGLVHGILLLLLLILLCGLLFRHQPVSTPDTWRGLSSYGLGIIATLLALALPAPASDIAALMACATLVPLLPFHSGFVASLSGLPGNLPAFLALLLPMVGFHDLQLLLPTLSETVLHTLAILALAGAVYGSLRALIQSRPLPRLAYAALAFLCLLWWYVAETGTAPIPATIYLTAVGLATSGLLLAWFAIRARYGDVDLRALGGMAYPMPRFSTLLALLALAALGMPPFGVFSGFLSMLLLPTFTPSGPFAVIMLVWLTASWYQMELVQQLVFGRGRVEIRYEDLRRTEFLSLVLVLFLLLVLGTAPSRWFEPNAPTPPLSTASQENTWTR